MKAPSSSFTPTPLVHADNQRDGHSTSQLSLYDFTPTEWTYCTGHPVRARDDAPRNFEQPGRFLSCHSKLPNHVTITLDKLNMLVLTRS
ncbi:hypothetical protein TNCV_3696771 [Trichonephila clavipes]|uniref:Uncharacterized protein n=1 Tax=Trichonephila clavipes TaxID=2585209 RepID=A0A8X6SE43_TRICX|nr:hypothetical protein TNCV_3696771 [Trichonephila clavipes]